MALQYISIFVSEIEHLFICLKAHLVFIFLNYVHILCSSSDCVVGLLNLYIHTYPWRLRGD